MSFRRTIYSAMLVVFASVLGSQVLAQPVYENKTPTGFSVSDSTSTTNFAIGKEVTVQVDRLDAPKVGTDGDSWVEVPGLGPWETVAIEYLIEGDCSWCWSWVYVDSTNAVTESVETDNAFGPIDVFGKYW